MPYAPGVQYNGDRYWFAGLANLGRSIGDALQLREQRAYNEGLRRNERKQQEVDLAADEAKKAKVTRTFLSTWLPDQKDQFDSMGLAELTGTAQGLAERMADKDRALRQEAQQLNIDAVRSAADRRGREQDAARGFLSDIVNFTGLSDAAGGEPAMMLSPEVRTRIRQPGGIGLEALRRNPDVPEDLRDRVLNSAMPSASRGAWGLSPGQVVDFGDGSVGLATGPNALQIRKPPRESTTKPTVKVQVTEGVGKDAKVVTREMTAAEYDKYVQDEERKRREPLIAAKLKRRAELQAEIGSGNRYVGPESSWLPSFGDRQKELLQVEQELRDLGHQDAGAAPDSAAPAKPAASGQTEVVNGIRITRTK